LLAEVICVIVCTAFSIEVDHYVMYL